MSVGPLGMSSGMDINGMVSKIVDSERVPKQARLDNDRAQIGIDISAYGRLRESLDTMKNLMANFRQDKAFAVRTVESTDDGVVSASATTEAIAGRYGIDVLQLAQSHKVASEALSDDTKFGPGKLQISLGEKQFSVDVRHYSNLKDVVRGINGANNNPGVRASIINDANGQRLIVASDKSGVDNKIKISAESESTNPLKKLEYQTLEERLRSLEEARTAAAEALSIPIKGQDVANQQTQKLASAIIDSAKEPDARAAENILATTSPVDSASGDNGLSTTGYVKAEESIPGWTETASGTLLDSYQPPEPELDKKALDKMALVPGWSNTASGTLTDSYLTPQEAEEAEALREAVEQADILAQRTKQDQQIAEKVASIEQSVANGSLTEEQGYQAKLDLLPPEERAKKVAVDKTQAALKSAQDSMVSYSGMTETQAAQDSIVMLDGIAQLSSENNVIENAIDGIDITVKGVTDPTEQKTEIGVEYDRQSVRDDILQFVSAYNQFHQVSSELSAVDPQTGASGPLAGDSVVRTAQARLKTAFSTAIEQAPEDLKTLTEFGITSTRQGTLEVNDKMLDRQLNNNFTRLEEFFGGNKGFAKKVEDAIQSMTGVTGTLRTRENSLREQNYRLDDQQASLDRRMESLQERTKSKFMAMQDATAKMQGQLSGMMNALGQ
ncbi:flagellar filament capping protein FliD [Vibrio sp. TH_r3]|uniref:flagellar filament capping protein FliD n=1 Tax=Vibrio sp. TH_r3 TaxID=3082084 RepID=UPI0029534FC4|nr:flagellar filament capping protein FliD [Vibrio sp. TH_r3]MDV7103228.1 flagellar filament capping protein FliD [Vibrio sp. TH_r3]